MEYSDLREMSDQDWAKYKAATGGNKGPGALRQFRRESVSTLRRMAHGPSDQEKSRLHTQVDAYHRRLEAFLVEPEHLLHWEKNHNTMQALLKASADAIAQLPKKESVHLRIQHQLLQARLMQGEGKVKAALTLLDQAQAFLSTMDKTDWSNKVEKQLNFEKACLVLWDLWQTPKNQRSPSSFAAAQAYFVQSSASRQESFYYQQILRCVQTGRSLYDMETLRHGVTTSRFVYTAPTTDYPKMKLADFKTELKHQTNKHKLYRLRRLAEKRTFEIGDKALTASQRKDLGEYLFEYHLLKYMQKHPQDHVRENEVREWWKDQLSYLDEQIQKEGLTGFEAAQRVQEYFSTAMMKYDPDKDSIADFYFSKTGASCQANSVLMLSVVLSLGIELKSMEFAVQKYKGHDASVLFKKTVDEFEYIDLVAGGEWSSKTKAPIYSLAMIYYNIAKEGLRKKTSIQLRKHLIDSMRLAEPNEFSSDDGVIVRDKAKLQTENSIAKGFYQSRPPLEAERMKLGRIGSSKGFEKNDLLPDTIYRQIGENSYGFFPARGLWSIDISSNNLDLLHSIDFFKQYYLDESVRKRTLEVIQAIYEINHFEPLWKRIELFVQNPIDIERDFNELRQDGEMLEYFLNDFFPSYQDFERSERLKRYHLIDTNRYHLDQSMVDFVWKDLGQKLSPQIKALLKQAKVFSDKVQADPKAFLDFLKAQQLLYNKSEWFKTIDLWINLYNLMIASPEEKISFTTPAGKRSNSIRAHALNLIYEVSVFHYTPIEYLVVNADEASAPRQAIRTPKNEEQIDDKNKNATQVQADLTNFDYLMEEQDWLTLLFDNMLGYVASESNESPTYLDPAMTQKVRDYVETATIDGDVLENFQCIIRYLQKVYDKTNLSDPSDLSGAWGEPTEYLELSYNKIIPNTGSETKPPMTIPGVLLMPRAVYELYQSAFEPLEDVFEPQFKGILKLRIIKSFHLPE